MTNPFEDAAPKLTPEELRRALNGDRAGTWARFAAQRSTLTRTAPASGVPATAPAGGTGLGATSTGVRPTPAQIRTAARVRASNPDIFDPKAKADGGLNLGFTPEPGPAPDFSKFGWKDAVNIGWLGFSFFANPLVATAGLVGKAAVKSIINQKPPTVPELIKSPPVQVFDFIEKQTATDNTGQGGVNFIDPPANLPAPPAAVFEYSPEGTLTGVFIGVPEPKAVDPAPGVDTTTTIDTTTTDTGSGASTGAGGFGGGYGGDPPSNDGSAYGRE